MQRPQSEEIHKFFLQIVAETAKISPAFMNWSKEMINEAVQKYDFVVDRSSEGDVCAFICYITSFDFIEILALGTIEKFQRQGKVGSLLRNFTQDCSATSKYVTLEVHSKNERAIALYQKCGFKTVRIRKSYYSDGADAIVMGFGTSKSSI
jgi:ribosomal protein S18 acetylase RimI-like enzyme